MAVLSGRRDSLPIQGLESPKAKGVADDFWCFDRIQGLYRSRNRSLHFVRESDLSRRFDNEHTFGDVLEVLLKCGIIGCAKFPGFCVVVKRCDRFGPNFPQDFLKKPHQFIKHEFFLAEQAKLHRKMNEFNLLKGERDQLGCVENYLRLQFDHMKKDWPWKTVPLSDPRQAESFEPFISHNFQLLQKLIAKRLFGIPVASNSSDTQVDIKAADLGEILDTKSHVNCIMAAMERVVVIPQRRTFENLMAYTIAQIIGRKDFQELIRQMQCEFDESRRPLRALPAPTHESVRS